MSARTLSLLGLTASLCATAGAAPLAAQQHQIRLEWSKNLTEYRGQNGRRITHVCPPQGRLIAVTGTDIYTDDSGVCSAAVHAGLITLADGGVVTIVIGPGKSAYSGSARNGVTSQSFRSWWGSFSFDRSGAEGQIDWGTNAEGVELAGRPLTVLCPPAGKSTTVWGTDTYAETSSICVAAVHAGLITLAAGGRVTVEDAGAQQSYAASERNGVQSRHYGGTSNGFRLSSGAATTASTPQEAGSVAPTVAPGTVAMPTVTPRTVTPPTTTAPAAASGTTTTTSGTPTTAVMVGDRTPMARPASSAMGAAATLAAPTNVRAEPLHYRGTVMVHWDTVPGATGYDILQKLPDGKYAGAMPLDRVNGYGPERSQGITMQLVPGPLSFSVVAHYGPGEDSPPSAPASVVIPRWYGRYRVSILGFKVERETADDPLETDGKHDEIYMRVAAAERGPQGDLIGPVVERQTLVHGDINYADWRRDTSPTRRIRAGNASVDGGLLSGDAFPASPWKPATSSSDTTSFPLRVWEGDLMQGHNTVQVAFNLWESDQRPGQPVATHPYSLEAMALERAKAAAMRIEPTLAGEVVANVTTDPALAPALGALLGMSSSYTRASDAARGMVLDKVLPRLPAYTRASTALDRMADEVGATALALKMGNRLASQQSTLANGVNDFLTAYGQNITMLLNAKDRPLGVRKDSRGVLVALPGILNLSFESAEREALVGNGPHDIGPGIYLYRFEDGVTGPGGNGKYVVYLQVERLQ